MAYSKRDNKLNKYEKTFKSIAWILAVLVCVKSIFTDFGPDDAYQVAMSYRNLNGDAMFLQMWEPHQMSIFLNNGLMFLYHLIVPSYKGVAIYLQVCGTLAFAGLAAIVYRTVKDVTGSFTAHLISIFLVVFKVKQTPLLHFANMEIGFSILMFCTVIALARLEGKEQDEDLRKREEKRDSARKLAIILLPIATGALLFLQALSYPTCIISAVAIVALYIGYTKKKLRNILLFILGAAVCGFSFAGYLLYRIGLSELIEIFKNIFMSDTHSAIKFGEYWPGLLTALAGLAGAAALAAVIKFALGKVIKVLSKVSYPVTMAACYLAIEIVMILLQRKTGIDYNCSFFIVPGVMMILGLTVIKKMTKEERMIWIAGSALSLASFIATLMLTDLGIITILAYLVLGGAVSFIPAKYICKDYKVFLSLIILLILFHRGMVIWGYGNTNSRMILTYEAQNIIRSGPGMGLVVDHVTKNQAKMDEYDFDRFTNDDDKIFIIGQDIMDPLVFLYPNGEISNYSVIDTPWYNESIEEYFKLNPEKEPTVIAVSCWYGVPMVAQDSYIMDWVNERYEPVGDGDYWRFYRARTE